MFKGKHFDRSVILLCVRWYLAYNLSLRNLEEMMTERGISVDHATIHCWTVHYAPLLLEQFNQRKRPVTGRWHVDETYIRVCGRWLYRYRAIDSNGNTVDFWFSERRNLAWPSAFCASHLSGMAGPSGLHECVASTNSTRRCAPSPTRAARCSCSPAKHRS